AVHYLGCAHHFSAERRSDRLVPETYAQNGLLAGKPTDHFNADASFMGCTRAGRDEDVAGTELLNFVNSDLIVSAHLNFLPHLPKILDQVVGKRVVIVENKDHSGLV